MDEVKEISNTYEQEIARDMTASQELIKKIKSLNKGESEKLNLMMASEYERKYRSLGIKMIQDYIKQIKDDKNG